MRSLAISGVALAALALSQPAYAAIDSQVGAPKTPPAPMGNPDVRAPGPIPEAAPPPPGDLLGNPDVRGSVPVVRSRHHAMHRHEQQAGYVRPSYGFQLPPEWMRPDYYVSDYRAYGLDRPAPGFGWSHYYDDLVLTDQWGRVYDVADGYDRDRRHGYGRDTDGIVGGVAGAAVGAVAGNVIAGAGSRLAGSLIGGGVGALAGLAIELAVNKNHRHGGHHEEHGARDDGYYRDYGRAHWGGYPQQAWSYGGCNCGGETVTTTTVTQGGGGYMIPREVVTYENVYAPVETKYRVRAAPTKYRVREQAPAPTGKVHERTKLHTRTY
jgi:Ni/Co efflux regulator RcnB